MTLKLAFYPRFESAEVLADRYWRAVHYLGPVADRIATLAMAGAPGAIAAPPAYLDQTLSARARPIADRLQRPTAPAIADADVVIIWDQRRTRDSALRGKRVVTLDPAALHEGDLWIEFGAELAQRGATPRERARTKLLQMLHDESRPIAHVFGTGPSLASVDASTLESGVSIVCNSVVKDAALMAALQPRLITAIDPIFHAGPSRHAGAFRTALARCLEQCRGYFVIQERDAYLYEALLGPALRERVIAIPVRYALGPNVALTERSWVTATRNVLTLTMLPLAASLAPEVRLYGCDGRSTRERDRFWSYAPAANFDVEASLQHQAHPGFFSLDYQDYYALHCETTRRWVEAIERRGGRLHTATPSFIPALAARRMEQVPRLESPQLAFELAGRAAYCRRGAQSLYGAVLTDDGAPQWLKSGLRATVRASREIGL